jgi:signal transduction histidine kinase
LGQVAANRYWLGLEIRPASPRLAPKELLGVSLVLAVVAVATMSLRLYAAGPDWGLQLAVAPDGGGVVAAAVRGHGVAWEQHIRPGDAVLSIDSLDARGFAGRDVGRAQTIVVADATGLVRTASAPELRSALTFWLFGVGLLFALLGAAVQRWSPDERLGHIFFVFCGASALALGSIPGAIRGNAPTHLLAASAATVAPAAFTTLFLWFPRPLRYAHQLASGLAVVCAALLSALAILYARGEGAPPLLESSLFIWLGGNLVVGTIVLALRAISPANRHILAPLALGVGLGIFPLALLDALPQALGRQPIMWADSASASAAAIPLAFAYAILRHRLFALDARLRRFLVHLCAAVGSLAMFVATWLVLRALAMDDQLAAVLAAALAALAAPGLFARTERALDAWLYPSLRQARADDLSGGLVTVRSIAQAFAIRSRELVPTRWVALLVKEGGAGHTRPHWSLLGGDGDVPVALRSHQPAWPSSLSDDRSGTNVVPIEFSPGLVAAVGIGPRLDGTSIGGIDLETIRLLARRALPSIEAALLRGRTEADARFRRGMSELARNLAAVGPVVDVLRVTAQHAATLLETDSAVVWLQVGEDRVLFVPHDDVSVAASASIGIHRDLDSLLGAELASRLRDERVAHDLVDSDVPGAVHVLACWLGEPAEAEALLVLMRMESRRSFTDEDERRALEIADQSAAALQRSQIAEQAADAEALRELDRLRTDLMSMVAHELRNPLTAVLGYAQLLRRRAGSLTPAGVAEMADRIERSANFTQDIVRDLSTTSLHEAGRLAVRPEDVDLGAALAAIARNFQVLPGGERVRVDVPARVSARADPARLEQMVGNLLLNALRYAPSGPIVVLARPAGDGEVWIEVSDEGPGVPDELQAKVWDKFYRAAGSDRVTQGMGLGLAVVRTLAELHGGRVELESSPGNGSTFRIVLPRAAQ